MIPFLLISGMHRSGTSFLARAMNLLGVYLGETDSLTSHDWLFEKDNLRGHWENKKFLELTEKTLSLNNGSWDNIPEKIVINDEVGLEIKKCCETLVKHHSLAAGFKDPRILLCLDSWLKYLPKNLIVIGIFRHPLKVAESLKIRNQFEYDKSLKLWKTYNQKLLEILEKHDGFLLDFDWPKEKMLSELNLISQKVGLFNNIDLSKWYSEDLFKSDKTFKSDYPLSDDLRQTYSLLQKRSQNNSAIKVKKITRTGNELEDVISDLIRQIQNQSEHMHNMQMIMNLKEKLTPLSQLLFIYYQRPDLQSTFPEVSMGDLSNLLNWATNTDLDKIGSAEETAIIHQYRDFYREQLRSLQEKKQIESTRQTMLEQQASQLKQKDVMIEQNTKKLKELTFSGVEKNNKIEDLEKNIQGLKSQETMLNRELETLRNSIPYNIAKNIMAFLDEKLPPTTRLGRTVRKIIYEIYKKRFPQLSYTPMLEFVYDYELDDLVDKETLRNQIESLEYKPKISIIMPVYNTNPSFLKSAIHSVKNQYYTNWQLCICDDGSTDKEIHKILKDESRSDNRIFVAYSEKNGGISVASNNALNIADGDFTVLLDHDDELTKNSLLEIVKTINENPDVDFIYSDEDKINENGKHVEPFFKPDWSPDLFFSYNYTIHVSVFRTPKLKKIGGFRTGYEGSQDYDLILRYMEQNQKIIHISRVLYSWRKSHGSTALSLSEKGYAYEAGKRALKETLLRRKIDASCEDGVQPGTYRIRYEIRKIPLISIIIPTRTIENLKICIESIIKKSTYKNFEIIVMDSSKNEDIRKFCEDFKEIQYNKVTLQKFNFSKVNNDGVKKSRGEYIIFLNDDTQVITPDWIEGLLEHAQREEIGIAGAKLLYQNDHVQHAGTIIGIQWHAGNYGGMDKNDGGYFSLAKIIRNCSAVTAACMIMKKDLFNKVGGFDEKMAHSWQDVDLCIRTTQLGKRIIFTPYSMLYHYEGRTRGSMDASTEELTTRRIFKEKHRDFIEKGDPYYNQNLSLISTYRISKKYPKPIRVLSDLYEIRPALQQTFPNEQNNGFKSMIDWAATHGVISDSHKEILQQFYEYYFENCSNEAKPLARKIQLYIQNEKLRNEYPEVMMGNLKRFLEYAQTKI